MKKLTLSEAFDLGYEWAFDVSRTQTQEDSRAVGRTLLSKMFDPLELDLKGFNSFQCADLGICDGKRRIHDALAKMEAIKSDKGVGS